MSVGSAESIILSVGGAESMMLSALVLRALYSQHQHWEHHTLSATCWEYDTLSAIWSCYYAMLTAVATNTTPIGNYDNPRFTAIIKSASTAAPIGLLPKMAKFCHTSNRLLVRCQCRCALMRLTLIPLWAVGWSVGQLVGWSDGQPVSWSVGQLVIGRSAGWLVGWLVGRSVGWSVSQSVGLSGGWSAGWLSGCLVSRLVGRLVSRPVGRSVGRSVGWSVGWLAGRLVVWSVGCWSVDRSKIKVPGLKEFPSKRIRVPRLWEFPSKRMRNIHRSLGNLDWFGNCSMSLVSLLGPT